MYMDSALDPRVSYAYSLVHHLDIDHECERCGNCLVCGERALVRFDRHMTDRVPLCFGCTR